MPDAQALKQKYVDLHGYWSEGLQAALEADADFFGDYLQMAEVALGADHLEPKIRHLVLIAANAAVTHLHAEGVAQHIQAALEVGATRQEILETLQIASVLGIHAYTDGAPLLIHELENGEASRSVAEPLPRGEAYEQVKREFSEKRGYWNDLLDAMVRSSPDFVMGYTAFSSTPWRKGTLEPRVRELLYVAIDVSTTHLYKPGIEIHTRNALRYGATPEQVAQVIQLVALIGMQSFVMGVPLLTKALANAEAAAQ